MNSPKRRKDTPISSASLRPFKSQKPTQEPPLFSYTIEKIENTALDTIFTRLFIQITEADKHKND